MAHIWEKSYPQGVSWDAPLPPPVPLESLLETAATKWPQRIALDFYDRTFTFRELYGLAARAARGLQALGVGPGVHVGLHLPNTPHFVIGFFAVLMAGGRVVNFSPLAAPRELQYQLADSEAQVMITLGLPMLYPQIAALNGTGKFQTLVVCSIEDFLPAPVARAFGPAADRIAGAGREIDFAALLANDGAFTRHPHGPLEDEIAVLQYTGGTTGQPKGAMLTHANFCAVINIFNHWDRQQCGDEEADKALAVLPLFHIFGLTFIMLLAVANGEQVVLHIKFDPDRVLADISRKKITVFLGGADHVHRARQPSEGEGVRPLLGCDVGLGRRASADGSAAAVRSSHRPRSEGGLRAHRDRASRDASDHRRPARQGSVGLPAPHTILEVVDLETGDKVLPIGEKGEICFRGPQVMKGYWKKPEATEEAFRGGRFHTGDIGFLDQDGFVTLVDRKKDMILSGGFNVFPRNIEEAIYEHPGVAEVTVIGIPDAYRGQSAKAFIALKPGQPPFGIDELKAFLADKLAKYEMPTEMEIRASLPKTPVGKLSKKELVAEEMAKRQAADPPPGAPKVA